MRQYFCRNVSSFDTTLTLSLFVAVPGVETEGVEEDTESKGGCGDITADGNIRLGCHANLLESARYWKGGIGCVQVYNRTLSALEVTQNFETQRIRFGV